jgi:hypothetical protein
VIVPARKAAKWAASQACRALAGSDANREAAAVICACDGPPE